VTVDDTASPVRLVVFDLGGVLVRIVRSWAEAHERAGLPPDHPALSDPEFLTDRSGLSRLHQLGAIDPPTWAARIAEVSGGAYSPQDATAVLTHWQYGEYPGADALLGDLERAGVEVAALSNTNEQHWAVLRPAAGPPAYPTVARFRRAYASHELGLMKPDPAIYAHVEDDTGVPPEGILFFEDTQPNAEAARARGWRAEVVDPAGDPIAQIRAALARHGVPGFA
jgi:FMN phosphatase YigB (HAD superfamily)